MSIYDSYKLSNSTAIPLYEGSAGQESIQVGQYMQGLYDQASQGAGVISSSSQNIPAMLEDQQHVKDLQEKVKTSVDTWSKANNWEDYLPDVLSLGREYASRAAELAAPLKQYADWREKVLDNPDLKLNSDQKDTLDKMERAKYKGLQKDAMGKLVGEFKGGRLAKNIDTTAKADEWLKGYVEKQGGTDLTVDNGITKYRDAKGWHILDKPTIKNIMDAGRYLDPEYKDYVGQEAAMAGWNYVDKVQSIDQLNNSPLLKAEVENKMKKGMSLKNALADVVPMQKADAISKMMDEYAYNKYAHNNINTITERGLGALATARGLKEIEKDDFRLAGQGAGVVPLWAMDPTELTTEIKNTEDNVNVLRQQLTIAEEKLKKDPNNTDLSTDVDRKTKQLQQTEKVLNNSKAVWNNTRDKTVAAMNISDGKGGFVVNYQQYLDTKSARLETELKKAIPNGITYGGKSYSVSDISKAIVNGKFTSTIGTERDAEGNFNQTQTYKLVMPDGKTITTEAGKPTPFSKAIKASTAVNNELNDIDTKAKAMHRSIVENYSIKSNAIGLDQTEQRVIGDYGISSATIYKSPGSGTIYTGNDVRSQRFIPEVVNAETGRITGRFKDAEGNLTDPMDVEMTTNLIQELRPRLAKNNIGGKWNGILASMDDFSYTGALTRVKPGTVLDRAPGKDGLSDPKKPPLKWKDRDVEMVLQAQDNDREWVLRYKNGPVILDKDGEQYRTPNISEADSWIRQMTPDTK